jgi:hypothetical protein
MYSWIVYLHILATFTFLLVHGVQSVVSLRMRSQRDPAVIRTWMELYANNWVYGVLYGSLLVLLLTGIIAGFMGRWWGRGWMWASLILLIAIIVAMYALGSAYYNKLRRAIGMAYFDGRKEVAAQEPLPEAEIAALLERSPAILLAAIGYGGIAVILWLMRFKPF